MIHEINKINATLTNSIKNYGCNHFLICLHLYEILCVILTYYNYDDNTCFMHATDDDTSAIHIGPQLRTESDLTGKSFRWRASGQYNMIPENLRKTDKLAVFKNELKKWTWLNIPI